MSELSDQNWFSNDAATFGDRVAAAREAQGLSQKDLAKRLGIAAKTLEAWENDLSEPRANRLQMLSGILNVSMPWLLTGEGPGVAPGGDAGPASDVTELMTEMRSLRLQMSQAAERMGLLEKRLKAALASDPA